MKFALALATLLLVFKLMAGQQCRYVIEPDCSSSELTKRVDGKCFTGDWINNNCQRFKKTQITMQICTVKATKTMRNFNGHYLGTPYYDVIDARLLSSVIFFLFLSSPSN